MAIQYDSQHGQWIVNNPGTVLLKGRYSDDSSTLPKMFLLLAGDAQIGGSDHLLLAGDAQGSGSDHFRLRLT